MLETPCFWAWAIIWNHFQKFQPLHPFLDIQVGLRLLKMAPNDFPLSKTWVQKPKSILQKAQNNFEILGLVFQTTHFRRAKWRSKHGKMQKIKAHSFLQFFLKFHKMGSFLHGKQHLGEKNQFCLTTYFFFSTPFHKLVITRKIINEY